MDIPLLFFFLSFHFFIYTLFFFFFFFCFFFYYIPIVIPAVSVSVSVCLALPFYIFIKTANKKKALLQLQMGLYYRTYLEGPSTVYGCADCGTHLATSESIISRVSSLITCFVMQSVEINSKLHHVAISRSTWSSLFV